MRKYLIENIRTGLTAGGMDCGPVPGCPIAEVTFRDESGAIRYRDLVKIDDVLSFHTTDEETFDDQVSGEWEQDFQRERTDPDYCEIYSDFGEFWESLDYHEPQDTQLNLLLYYMIRASYEEENALKSKAIGALIGTFDIPVCFEEAEDITEFIMSLLDRDDTEQIDAIMEKFGDALDEEEIFREALRRGAEDYVRSHVDDFDLNDTDGGSYFDETDDPDIREILLDAGANPEYDPEEYRFFYDDENCEILAFDDDLRQEAIEKVLKLLGVTREGYIEKLSEEFGAEDSLPEPLSHYTFGDIEALLNIADDDIPDDFEVNEWCDYNLCDLLEDLGYDVEEEGQSGPHGHGSWRMRFIR